MALTHGVNIPIDGFGSLAKLACSRYNIDLLKWLYKNGANLNGCLYKAAFTHKSENEETALAMAEFLLQQGEPLMFSHPLTHQTPLQVATLPRMRALLEKWLPK
jgi:hypothetical protein